MPIGTMNYTAKLPGSEYSEVDLTDPVSAAKVLHDIDHRYGKNKVLCTAIMGKTFQADVKILKLLADAQEILKTSSEANPETWHKIATINRGVRIQEIECRLLTVAKLIQVCEL